ncbi:MAG: cobyrinate a,c-diamide synthase [Nitrospirae bacterium]|nr:cobyrinate a,c-diamide synthase [Nitrospirota bacterium]
MKGIIIAGTHSGCGKTTVTLGILAALKKKGLTVQSFKAGPDFIDAGLHKLITGRPSRNLDLWMCGIEYAAQCYKRNAADADMAVVEGVMGLYDGNMSTAYLASTLDLPVILVVDAYGMAESAGAVVKGFKEFRVQSSEFSNRKDREAQFPESELQTLNSKLSFAGVIFNRVASENHFNRLKGSVRDAPVLGYLPRDIDFEVPHRHLGLATAEENPLGDEAIQKLTDVVLKYIDVKELLKGARVMGQGSKEKTSYPIAPCPPDPAVRIAVARDRAFCFYYEDNLDLLRDAGAEIITFSPLSDSKIPDGVDALYIGGGYPELYAKELSANGMMLDSIKQFAAGDMPVYAECGGFMYLTNGIWSMEDGKSKLWEMAGIFPFDTQMKDRLSRLGYREIYLKEDCILGRKDSVIRGHEFHYSEIEDSSQQSIYSVRDGSGNLLPDEGYRIKNTIGSYVHTHFGSNREIAKIFIDYIKEHHGNHSACRTRQS